MHDRAQQEVFFTLRTWCGLIAVSFLPLVTVVVSSFLMLDELHDQRAEIAVVQEGVKRGTEVRKVIVAALDDIRSVTQEVRSEVKETRGLLHFHEED